MRSCKHGPCAWDSMLNKAVCWVLLVRVPVSVLSIIRLHETPVHYRCHTINFYLKISDAVFTWQFLEAKERHKVLFQCLYCVHMINRNAVSVSLECRIRISIVNHMISSAIWDKLARVNFSKTNQIARRASAICSLWKIYECWFIPNCTRKIMWLLVNNTLTKIVHRKWMSN